MSLKDEKQLTKCPKNFDSKTRQIHILVIPWVFNSSTRQRSYIADSFFIKKLDQILKPRLLKLLFFKDFWRLQVLFIQPFWVDFWWQLLWASKPGWIPCLYALLIAQPSDSPLVWHLPTSWQPALPFWSAYFFKNWWDLNQCHTVRYTGALCEPLRLGRSLKLDAA